MEKINVISIPFYKFQSEKQLNEKIFNDIIKLPYTPEVDPNLGSVYEDYYNEDLFDWFNICVNKVSKELYLDSLSFPIVDCWVNKYTAINRLKKHNHSNSVICGLYYVTGHDSGQTIFQHPNPWTYSSEGPKFYLSIDKNSSQPLEGRITPQQGTLILFPGNLYHYMNTYKDTKNTRYTIAFNTFPSGELSNRKSMRLAIKTTSMQDMHRKGQ